MPGHTRKVASGRWIARFPVGGGRYRSRTFARKIDAERWLTEQNHLRDRGSWVDPKGGTERFEQAASAWMASRRSLAPSTRARDESLLANHVLPAFGHMPIGRISADMVEEWVDSLDLAPSSVHKAVQVLSGVLSKAPGPNPARDVALPRLEGQEMRFLTLDEVGTLAEACGPYAGLVWVTALTGLRWGEVTALRGRHLDLAAGRLTVSETLTEVNGHLRASAPKTKASRRTITLSRTAVELLAAQGAIGDALVFTSPQGASLRRSSFRRRVWVPAVRASVGEPMRFHDLRHTHVALLIAQGEHPKVIQARLGHASITTTLNVYGHLFDGLDQAAADRLDEAVRHWQGTRTDATVVPLPSPGL